jgi:uncharacterized membrane protein
MTKVTNRLIILGAGVLAVLAILLGLVLANSGPTVQGCLSAAQTYVQDHTSHNSAVVTAACDGLTNDQQRQVVRQLAQNVFNGGI